MGVILSCCSSAADVAGDELPTLDDGAAFDFNQAWAGRELGEGEASQRRSASGSQPPPEVIGAPRTVGRVCGDSPAPVRCTSPFADPDSAALYALRDVHERSVRKNVEYGGLIYQRPDKGTFGFTGPVTEGDAEGFSHSNPFVRVPPGTEVAGDLHTHGAYSEVDPKTEAVTRTQDKRRDMFRSNRFSRVDIIAQTKLARGPEDATSRQKKRWYQKHFGAPRTSAPMHFYLGTPSGEIRRHTPSEAPTAEATAARDPETNDIMHGYGSDVVIAEGNEGVGNDGNDVVFPGEAS
jgi:Domain of unknown function (DUF4329)